MRAPVLAALFLIMTFATLAMPGSANFVGEILILFGTFEDKLVYGLVASVGVVLAAVYMIRVFQRTMHNRVGPAVGVARDRRPRPGGDRAAGGRDRGARASTRTSCSSAARGRRSATAAQRRRQAVPRAWRREVRTVPRSVAVTSRSRTSPAPDIDYKALSPLIAVVGGSIVVLMVGLFRSRFVRARWCRRSPRSRCSRPSGSRSGSGSRATQKPIIEGALAVDTLALGISVLVYVAGLVAWSCPCAPRPCARRARASTTRCCWARSPAWSCWPAAENLITLFVGLELLSIPLYVLCATELRRAPRSSRGSSTW